VHVQHMMLVNRGSSIARGPHHQHTNGMLCRFTGAGQWMYGCCEEMTRGWLTDASPGQLVASDCISVAKDLHCLIRNWVQLPCELEQWLKGASCDYCVLHGANVWLPRVDGSRNFGSQVVCCSHRSLQGC
jgi:hypothetical protein